MPSRCFSVDHKPKAKLIDTFSLRTVRLRVPRGPPNAMIDATATHPSTHARSSSLGQVGRGEKRNLNIFLMGFRKLYNQLCFYTFSGVVSFTHSRSKATHAICPRYPSGHFTESICCTRGFGSINGSVALSLLRFEREKRQNKITTREKRRQLRFDRSIQISRAFDGL